MRLFATALCILFPLQASALSCVPPSVEKSFGYAQEAAEPYVVVSGRVTFDESKLPKRPDDPNAAPKLTRIPAQISGNALSKAGFVTPFAREITLELRCFGPWCGAISSGEKYLTFMERTDSGYTLSVDPCNAYVLPNPTPQMLDTATACMNGAQCR